MYVQAYTLYSSVRPFGVSAIIGGVDKTGPRLFIIEPSGVAYVSNPDELYAALADTTSIRATMAQR